MDRRVGLALFCFLIAASAAGQLITNLPAISTPTGAELFAVYRADCDESSSTPDRTTCKMTVTEVLTPALLNAVDSPSDAECLAYDLGTLKFEWVACGSGAGDSITVNSSAATDPDFADGDVDWTLAGGNSITATVACTGCIDATDIATSGVATAEILDATILEADMDADEAPTDNDILTYDTTGANFSWQTPAELSLQGVLTNSAGLLAALSDETGTGLSVFSTSPTFTTGISLVPTAGTEFDLTGGTANAVNFVSDAGFIFDLDDDNDGANNVVIRDGADATLFSLNESGIANVLAGLDAIGAVDMDYGSADVTDHTFTTDGTGTAEIVLPAGSIDGTEILDDTVALTTDTSGNYVASVTNGTGITGGDGGSEGAALTIAATLGTAITSSEITDGEIVAADMAATLTFADAFLMDFGSNVTDATEGLMVPAHATDCTTATAEGQVCWEEDAKILWVGDGAAPVNINGSGAGDITDVFSCSTGDCASITMAATDLLDMSGTDASTATEGLILPQHATACTDYGTVAEGQACWDADSNVFYIGDGAGFTQVGGAETNDLESVATNAGDAEVFVGTGAGTGAYIAGLAACAADEKIEYTAGSPDTFSCEAINGGVILSTEIDASSELLAILGDETGTGVVMFNSGPTVTSLTDTSTLTAEGLLVDSTGDSVAGTFQAHSTQTGDILVVENSAATDLMTVDETGLITTAVGLDAIGAVDMDYGSVDVTDHTFTTDGTGDAEIVLPAGSISGTEILDASVDVSDDTNLTAGRSLTLTGDDVLADAELYTSTKCMLIETPADADDFLFWRTNTAITVTEIDCLVNAATSAVITVEECDANGGTCTAIEAAMTCAVTNTAHASTIDNAAVDAGDWMRVDVGAVTGTVGHVNVCMTYTEDD